MDIRPDPEFRAGVIARIKEQEFGERTGVHQSDLGYCLNKQAFRKLYPKQDTDHETLLYSLGWATQRWLTGKDKDEPEIEVDGIKVTLDCVVDGDEPTSIPWECKATFQSNNRPIEENIAWIRQIMAQCYVTGTTHAKLTRLCIMGKWLWVWNMHPKPAKLLQLIEENGEDWAEHPTLDAYHLEFTREELDQVWRWFKSRRELYLQVLETGEPLPKPVALPEGQSWECEWCKYTEECDGGRKLATNGVNDNPVVGNNKCSEGGNKEC